MSRILLLILCIAGAQVTWAAELDLRLPPEAARAASSLPSRAGAESPIARVKPAGLCQDAPGACASKAAALVYGSLHDGRSTPQQAVCNAPNPPGYCPPPVR